MARDRTEPSHFAVRQHAEGRGAVDRMYAEVFPDLRIRIGPTPSDGPMLLKQVAFGDGRLAYQRTSLRGRVTSTGNLGDMQMVGLLRRGTLGAAARGTALDSSRPFLFPEGDFIGDADDYELELLSVGAADLDRAARALGAPGAGRVRFTDSAPVTTAAERHWRHTQAHVISVLGDRDMLASPLLRQEVFRVVARAMLLTFPNTALSGEPPAARAAGDPTVDAAVSYIEANAHRAIDLGDIAAAVGTSPAALTRTFRKRRGHTPLQHLRDVRMHRARADLAAADAWSPITVREVAARWGFPQPGRFAVEYRERFHEAPSATLRR